MADRDSYTDKTAPKWPHGRDDMVFNRQGWRVLVIYLAVLAGSVGLFVWWCA